jgi:hypothetical protein
MIHVPRDATAEQIEAYRRQIEKSLGALQDGLDREMAAR